MIRSVRLGISTCPNDTFAFHALMHGKVDLRGINFQIELLDIQTLNERLLESSFDIAKASFHAAILLADQYMVLPSGSALGFGVGPLLLAAEDSQQPLTRDQLTLCPGMHTTAALLFEMFYPNTTRVDHTVFSEIMPRLRAKRADFGVCIHEGRFTWRQEGLALVEDLGTRWEQETQCPLPLGGIIASRSLDANLIDDVQSVIQDSIRYARANKAETIPTMRKYAQEFNDTVLMQHVDLYVNEWTVDLGSVGRDALDQLYHRAMIARICSNSKRPLEVFSSI
jgi:1,4-dihydroxy-6-naphthoate synthase